MKKLKLDAFYKIWATLTCSQTQMFQI